MRIESGNFVVVGVALALTGCARPGFGDSVGTQISEYQEPFVKAGLWKEVAQITSYTGALGPRVHTFSPPAGDFCVGERHALLSRPDGICSRVVFGRTDNGDYIEDSECTNDGMHSEVRDKYTGNPGTHLDEERWLEFWRDGDLFRDLGVRRSHFDYVGPCPSGMKVR